METIIGLEQGAVRLLPYQTAWARLFAEEKARLQTVLGDTVLDIQHVGSTSIPGLPAKPIIDIGIAVLNFEEAARCIAPLVKIGYVYLGENGIPRRHYFRKGNPRTHHLHMNEAGSVDWENQILFRDYLIDHPAVLKEYAELKIALASRFPADRDSYLAEKAPFITQILLLARQDKLAKSGS